MARAILALVSEAPDDAPPAIQSLARQALAIERYLMEIPAAAPADDAAQTAA
jgi:hypothetical protein